MLAGLAASSMPSKRALIELIESTSLVAAWHCVEAKMHAHAHANRQAADAVRKQCAPTSNMLALLPSVHASALNCTQTKLCLCAELAAVTIQYNNKVR